MRGVLRFAGVMAVTLAPWVQAEAQLWRHASAPTRNVSAVDRRAEFLNRIRAADPQQQTIVRALLNERNELGLILARETNLDDVPILMRATLAQLDAAFPGQDHVVVAYTPTEPPRVIGVGRLNARTRDMTYTPASH